MKNYYESFFKNKRILITGHTGFIGSWLTNILLNFGAKITGYSKSIPQKKCLFNSTNLENKIDHIIGNVCEYKKIKSVVIKKKPQIIFHLAAQSLVYDSFVRTRETYLTNLIGSANLLEILKEYNGASALIFFTSDKCYENKEKKKSFIETDRLGGKDPYSASKACQEILFWSYKNSFFKNLPAATVRFGNVFGGGDFAKNRIIPDLIRSIQKKNMILRQPNSIRPWQFVLEPLRGCLDLTLKLLKKKSEYYSSWNFGPSKDQQITVKELIIKANEKLGKKIKISFESNKIISESKYLMLDSGKADLKLNWVPHLNIDDSLDLTIKWYLNDKTKIDMYDFTQSQIEQYFRIEKK